MDGRRLSSRDVVDLIIALAPVAVLLAITYRDELTQARMWIEQHFTRGADDGEALRQVQKEISLMEHGEYGVTGADGL